MHKFLSICAAVALAAFAPSARADEASDVTDAFVKMVMEGCIPNYAAHASLSAFAKSSGLTLVPPELANAFLGDLTGVGYLKADPKFPMLIFGVADGSCHIYVRVAPDLDALVAGFEKTIKASKTGFTPRKVDTEPAGP